ncbi:hypothetical protein TNCV_864941 [Trichonephila clavipes]|nr:hypothetical protein TNCV_864941 [Trichonephila clavipes]
MAEACPGTPVLVTRFRFTLPGLPLWGSPSSKVQACAFQFLQRSCLLGGRRMNVVAIFFLLERPCHGSGYANGRRLARERRKSAHQWDHETVVGRSE